METKEYRGTMDKATWGPGPWQDEPDKVQWQDAATGLPCLIVRNHHGTLCGYVGVVEGHPAFGVNYDAVAVSVHGGLTFSAFCADWGGEEERICHVPAPGEPDHVWWLGFDCAHAWDLSPGLRATLRSLPTYDAGLEAAFSADEVYRDLDYVKAEVTGLARQLSEQRK